MAPCSELRKGCIDGQQRWLASLMGAAGPTELTQSKQTERIRLSEDNRAALRMGSCVSQESGAQELVCGTGVRAGDVPQLL